MPFYLGKRNEDDLILFHSATTPTKQTHGHLYKAVIGPFKSKVRAGYFARYGKNNPEIRTAADRQRGIPGTRRSTHGTCHHRGKHDR